MERLFIQRGFYSGGFLNFTPKEALREVMENNATIVDVREVTLTGYKRFGVSTVVYLPYSQLGEAYETLSRTQPLIIADSVGLRSHEAMVHLKEKEFTNIANLAGGIVEWERDGLPLSIDSSEQLDGSCICQLRPRNKK
ncbi:MAG TPA: rhodanese-like domain-containing protein [Williamwhitmania sp.]|nr:rhodanese-like domain-containing protein [Williamwhitmania sp.]